MMTHAKELIEPVLGSKEQIAAVYLDYARALKNITALMAAVGADPAKCKGCNAQIFFIRHANGKLAPYDADGTNHFITCPNAGFFKKK
ncbi:MAG TPA: hypothetical protein VGG62_14895 [Terracidiphilus sp.]|jgi:hypothetical protein